jgi:hypothetical protein
LRRKNSSQKLAWSVPGLPPYPHVAINTTSRPALAEPAARPCSVPPTVCCRSAQSSPSAPLLLPLPLPLPLPWRLLLPVRICDSCKILLVLKVRYYCKILRAFASGGGGGISYEWTTLSVGQATTQRGNGAIRGGLPWGVLPGRGCVTDKHTHIRTVGGRSALPHCALHRPCAFPPFPPHSGLAQPPPLFQNPPLAFSAAVKETAREQ